MLTVLVQHWLTGILPSIKRFLCKECRGDDVVPSTALRTDTAHAHSTDSDTRSDAELARTAHQDPHAFSVLFDRYFTRVYHFHYFRIRQKEDAEDLTSETFTKIFEKVDTFQDRGIPFSVWVFTIARHTLIDFTRRLKKNVTSLDALEEYQQPGIDFDHHAIDQTILMEKLWKAAAVLPEKHQQIWALKLSAGLSHKEIGAIVGMTENNVNVAISRSTKMLRTYLSHARFDPHA